MRPRAHHTSPTPGTRCRYLSMNAYLTGAGPSRSPPLFLRCLAPYASAQPLFASRLILFILRLQYDRFRETRAVPSLSNFLDPLPDHVGSNLQVLTHLKQIPSLLNDHPNSFDLELLAEPSSLFLTPTPPCLVSRLPLGVHQIGEGPEFPPAPRSQGGWGKLKTLNS